MDDNEVSHLKEIYTLFYRQGSLPNLQKNFLCPDGIQAAQLRGREHCKIMGFEFGYVKHFIADLSLEEVNRRTRGKEIGGTRDKTTV